LPGFATFYTRYEGNDHPGFLLLSGCFGLSESGVVQLMEFKDYYKILGVEPDAETPAIKSAYRKLARKYHPDLNPEKDAEDKFKEVAEAWEVLKDKQRRAEYDELRRYGGRREQGFEPPPGWQSSASSGRQSHQFDVRGWLCCGGSRWLPRSWFSRPGY
jgi:curved DNA-binding protein CbpA